MKPEKRWAISRWYDHAKDWHLLDYTISYARSGAIERYKGNLHSSDGCIECQWQKDRKRKRAKVVRIYITERF